MQWAAFSTHVIETTLLRERASIQMEVQSGADAGAHGDGLNQAMTMSLLWIHDHTLRITTYFGELFK